jgi:beta-glucosidase
MADADLTHAPYRDAGLSPAERVEDLLARMNLDEKLAQLGCVWSTQLASDDAFSEEAAERLLAHGTGHVTRIGAATGLRPAESARFMNRIQRFCVERTRLGIPALVHEESTAGFCARDASQFPQAIGLASTWDPELVERVAQVIREQMRAVGARQTLAPVLDVARDPRWGRVEETYGEDPYLASRLGVAYVRGLQGADLRRGVAATGKHFLGYGLSEGGHNHKPAHIGPRELREVFARPFLAAIQEAGLASVMNAYNEIDGLPCGGSKAILDELLRGELGFDGVVVADYFTTLLLITAQRVAATQGEAAARALEAGLDMELPALQCYGEPLRERVRSGAVDEALVDRALRRGLRLKFELGLFEAPYVDEAAVEAFYQTPAQRELSREAARASMVLLKNEGDLLPLARDPGCIAVIGPAADDPRLLLGDYNYPAHLEIVYRRESRDPGILPASDAAAFAPGPYYGPTVTPLAGIREAVATGTRVVHARGCDVLDPEDADLDAAASAARDADLAVVCVGGRSGLVPDCTSGEFRDAADLSLTGAQQALVEAVLATGTPTVVVLVNGRVLAIPELAARAPALLEAWLPGEEGGRALADLLFGACSPSGRLPVSLPRSVGQVPIYHYRRWTNADGPFSADYSDLSAEPLFAFGHGLSYTRFEYGELRVQAPEDDGPLRVEVEVRNAGDRAGDEVVQLYLQDRVASLTRPISQLAGFARVPLAPGEARRVGFEVPQAQLAFYDAEMRFVVEPGAFEVRVGASSADIRASASFELEGSVRELSPRHVPPTRVRVSRPAPDAGR